jgi:hypothetical protein
VQSLEHGSLPFKIEQTGASGSQKEYPVIAVFETSLDLNDVILFE